MTEYKCGHVTEILILDSNELSYTAYLQWAETQGINGSKKQCFDCYYNLNKKKETSK